MPPACFRICRGQSDLLILRQAQSLLRMSGSEKALALFLVGARQAVAAEVVDLAHDRLKGGLTRDILMLAPRRELAVGEQGLERDAAAGDAALDRADRAAADL